MLRITIFVVFVAFVSFISASPNQCKGTCPAGYPNDDVYLLPHEDCTKYCSCVYGTPVEMPCPPNLHYSEKDRVCTDIHLANCSQSREFIFNQVLDQLNSKIFADTDRCSGACPSNIDDDINGLSLTLAHEECRKFCKCITGKLVIRKCPKNFHYSLDYGSCLPPKEANCVGIGDDVIEDVCDETCVCPSSTVRPPTTAAVSTNTPPHPSKPTSSATPAPSSPSPTPGDTSGCLGRCDVWDDNDQVQHLPHKNCSQFCKCDFGTPVVFNCPWPLHFNPVLQVCDRPSHAGCQGDSATPATTTQKPNWPSSSPKPPSSTPSNPVPPKPTSSATPAPSSPSPTPGDTSGCIGSCSIWDDNQLVQHLPHKICSKFCKCDFGIPVVFDCPWPLYFNPVLQVCDRPSHAGCQGDSATPASTTQKPNWPSSSPKPPSSTPSNPVPSKPTSSATPAPSPPSPTPGDTSGCIGSCSIWDDNQLVQHLPHKICSKFCKCDFGIPVVFDCPWPLYFNPVLQVCDRPSHAGCKDGHPHPPGTTKVPGPSPPNPTTSDQPSPTPGDTSGCIGSCDVWDDNVQVQHLPHKNCSQFCKCDFGTPVVFNCPWPLHFNPVLQVCDRPGHAGCKDGHPHPPGTTKVPGPSPPNPTTSDQPSPTPGDTSDCIGKCSIWDETDQVEHLPHKICTKFCKCDFGIPTVFDCPSSLHFNPQLEVCDRPAHAKCTGIGGIHDQNNEDDIARKNIFGYNKLFRW